MVAWVPFLYFLMTKNVVPWILGGLVVALTAQGGCASRLAKAEAVGGLGDGSVIAKREVYKQIGSTQLPMSIYSPRGDLDKNGRPAIIFFFGGGWSSGTPAQFEAQARYFASRGMIAMTADYRVRSRHKSQVIDSVSDARSAIRWVRIHASRLGVDPQRIAASGGSAGGHLAASTAFIREFDDPREDTKTSAEPNALVLFNPALMLAPHEGSNFRNLRGVPEREFLGADPERISPVHHIKAGGPPTIIFHGSMDQTVPIETARFFSDRMKSLGNSCLLVEFQGQGHGFFNQEKYLRETLEKSDNFLKRLGWLQ
jgi:acetyl esterase